MGLRLAGTFFTEESRLLVNGEPTSVDDGLGQQAARVALQCSGVQVTFEQHQQDPLYVNVRDFVFMSLGAVPTTLNELHLAKEEIREKYYVITVEDLLA